MSNNTLRLPSATAITGRHLPPELWFQILGLLHPPEILSLGKTCKTVRELTVERNFWLGVLRAVLREHGIFPPTFPVDQMDVKHIQRAAMGPYLWNKLVQDRSEASTDDQIVDLLPQSRTGIYFELSGNEIEQYLVPGGRFLVTASCYDLRVWDLGVPGYLEHKPPLLLAGLPLTRGEEFESWSVALDDSLLKIAVVSSGNRVIVYEFSLIDGKPILRLCSGCIDPIELDEGEHAWQALCYGNRVCIHSADSEVIIWDYKENRYTLWPLEVGVGEWLNGSLVFTGDLLILFSTSVKAWSVPCPDRPCDRGVTYVTWTPDGLPQSPPDIEIPFPLKIPDRCFPFFSFPPDQWHHQPGNDLFFDTFYATISTSETYALKEAARYRLAIVVESDNTGAIRVSANLTSVQRLRFPRLPISVYSRRRMTPSRFNLSSGLAAPLAVKLIPKLTAIPDRLSIPVALKRCLIYSNDSNAVETTMAGKKESDGDDDGVDAEGPSLRLVSLRSDTMENWTWSLCSSSGRFVFVTNKTGTITEVVIAHYLP